MSKYTLTRWERETTINFNEEDTEAQIYTCSDPYKRKLDKMCDRFPDTYRCESRTEYENIYYCPIDRIRFASPVTEARREAGSVTGSKYGFKRIQLDATEQLNDVTHTIGTLDSNVSKNTAIDRR